ncbi:hypothetical protein GQ44DRAFT_756450 [Phaeosphaeriaceae sp. PMI808]|nr:hypothetical protein GQ44DRAFT_756450 [Phaeosphaeriaceae sp. PMI808]
MVLFDPLLSSFLLFSPPPAAHSLHLLLTMRDMDVPNLNWSCRSLRRAPFLGGVKGAGITSDFKLNMEFHFPTPSPAARGFTPTIPHRMRLERRFAPIAPRCYQTHSAKVVRQMNPATQLMRMENMHLPGPQLPDMLSSPMERSGIPPGLLGVGTSHTDTFQCGLDSSTMPTPLLQNFIEQPVICRSCLTLGGSCICDNINANNIHIVRPSPIMESDDVSNSNIQFSENPYAPLPWGMPVSPDSVEIPYDTPNAPSISNYHTHLHAGHPTSTTTYPHASTDFESNHHGIFSQSNNPGCHQPLASIPATSLPNDTKEHIPELIQTVDPLTGKIRFQCVTCKEIFSQRKNGKRHQDYKVCNGGKEPVRCTFRNEDGACTQTFNRPDGRIKHLATQHNFCNVCKKYFQDAVAHKKEYHKRKSSS